MLVVAFFCLHKATMRNNENKQEPETESFQERSEEKNFKKKKPTPLNKVIVIANEEEVE